MVELIGWRFRVDHNFYKNVYAPQCENQCPHLRNGPTVRGTHV